MATAKEPTTPDVWEELRKPFPKEVMGLLPKPSCYGCTQATKTARSAFDKHCDKHVMVKCKDCGAYISEAHIHLDFVGHAAVTDRLNTVCGPENWDLTPLGVDDYGNPKHDASGDLWFTLRIFEAKRICVGDGPTSKEIIGDALRNGAMRFGVALDLWTKDELESTLADSSLKNEKPSAELDQGTPTPTADKTPPASYIPEAQVKVLMKLASSVSGKTDKEDVVRWFYDNVGSAPNKVLKTDYDKVSEQIRLAGEGGEGEAA